MCCSLTAPSSTVELRTGWERRLGSLGAGSLCSRTEHRLESGLWKLEMSALRHIIVKPLVLINNNINSLQIYSITVTGLIDFVTARWRVTVSFVTSACTWASKQTVQSMRFFLLCYACGTKTPWLRLLGKIMVTVKGNYYWVLEETWCKLQSRS